MDPDTILLGSRLLLAFLFFGSGIAKIKGDPEAVNGIANLGLPAPAFLAHLSGACMVTGALGLVLGVYLKIATVLLALFVLVVTPMFLRFWTVQVPGDREKIMQAFVSNLAIIGGLAALAVAGSGAIALLPNT